MRDGLSEAVRVLRPAPEGAGAPGVAFDPVRLRSEFPVLDQLVHGKRLVYLDNAATTQKPRAVLEALDHYYRKDNANIHRGVHLLSQRATDAFEGARDTVQRFLNAGSRREVIFVRGTTEAINLVAQTFARAQLGAGDEILITEMEHHSNIVPWQMVCEEKGAKLVVAPIREDGSLNRERFRELLSDRTRLVALTHCSNALGTVNPVRELVEEAHAVGAKVLVDGAQAVAHLPVNVGALDCDFYCFSGHKVYGPTGIGVLWGRESLLKAMPPWQGGGEMIKYVTFERTVYNDLPAKFEAGTPDIAGAIGLGAALTWLQSVDIDQMAAHELDLLRYAESQAKEIPAMRLIGTAAHKAGILSFSLEGAHPHDVGTILDHYGVAVRTGHHCAMPVMQRYCVVATTRASFAAYNTRADVDALMGAIRKVQEVLCA